MTDPALVRLRVRVRVRIDFPMSGWARGRSRKKGG